MVVRMRKLLAIPRSWQSRFQRPRSFSTATGITNLWNNPKNTISDWPIKSCLSHANFFANQKTESTLSWLWQVIFVHTNLMRLETVKKNVYLDKFRYHATITFCSKISFILFLKVISMLFLRNHIIYATEPFKFALLWSFTKECVSSWLTNVHSQRLNKYTFSVSLKSPFMLLVFLQQIHWLKVRERKTAVERVNCNNERARKNSLETFSSNGKTISRRRNYSEPGFCGSDFGFFQSVRCPIHWTKVTEARGARLWSWYVCFSDEIGTRCFAWLRRLRPRKHPDALDLWQEPMMLRGSCLELWYPR